MAAVRTADVTWSGDLPSGSGTIDYVGSGAFSRMPVTWASRTERSDGRTSPEELLAAAHAACYAMAFSNGLAKAGHTAEQLSVRAAVTFDNVDGGWKVASSALTVKGRVPGLSDEEFVKLAEAAKDGCPISGAIKGNVALSVDASLEG
ncbi:MAG TPA: OsmC family peroxiredoxin [Candidatus Limnocylindrales bacterium]|jgi:osmotically inducible protein OsmC|nr:OsmC family peroxiredoxin [Candidatus Limnocylindrales bacterium]